MNRRLLVALGLVLLGQPPAWAGKETASAPCTQAAASEARIDSLIIQLGGARWREREAAQHQLIAIGRAALPALREALGNKDLEIATRAAWAIAEIECGMETRPSRSGFPYLTPEQRPLAAKAALDPATDQKDRYQAVWGLAISGYTRQGADALAAITADGARGDALRECAAMGLINFTQEMPAEVRRAIQNKLYGALDAEKDKLQGGVIQLLAAWGDADRVRKVAGDKLNGHPMEVIVLKKISSRDIAVARLWEIYQAATPAKSGNIALSRAWHAGEALIHWRDKRGIDILLECLTIKAAENAEDGSFRQSRHNTFIHLASALHDKFGYDGVGTWTPQLDEAIPRMVAWWKANRQTWDFGQPASDVAPKLERHK